MGANYCTTDMDGAFSQEQVRAAFKELADQAAWECGHSYSGSWGETRGQVLFPYVVPFPTRQEADEYVMVLAEKWEPAQAVRYRSQDETMRWFIGAWCSS